MLGQQKLACGLNYVLVGHAVVALSRTFCRLLHVEPEHRFHERSYRWPSTGCLLDEPEIKRHTTDGHVLAGVEIRLDEEGEISSRGPDCFLGYTDPELTASVFDGDGWYRTGDVGTLDGDGYLTITDRVSDIIVRGGENISAQEIEELVSAMGAVAEVGVVAAPDPRLGEHAAAVVRLRDSAPMPSLDDVRSHLAAAGLARQKWPESLYRIEEFPRTASGKVQKFRLRSALRGETAIAGLTPTDGRTP